MDKGAHFHACDFQVHTPRDANWNGSRATTDDERKAYAAELIQACREKGLDAIAITDHHDFAFVPFVRQAAANEVDSTGKPIPADQQLAVFPGVELTLSSPPCQALLLLSADFDEAKLPDILTALAIEPIPAAETTLKSVELVSPTAVTSLNDLEAKLSQHKFLKHRFIILPNVTDGGHKTLLREGFHEHYKQMHCVGGYVDGDYEAKTGVGKRNILEGRQQNNGYQPLAVIQTSDARSRAHDMLGAHRTWIKWAEPTAEAIRQACLAKESRLSLKTPALPSIRVTELTVSHSRFLGRINLELNPQRSPLSGRRRNIELLHIATTQTAEARRLCNTGTRLPRVSAARSRLRQCDHVLCSAALRGRREQKLSISVHAAFAAARLRKSAQNSVCSVSAADPTLRQDEGPTRPGCGRYGGGESLAAGGMSSIPRLRCRGLRGNGRCG